MGMPRQMDGQSQLSHGSGRHGGSNGFGRTYKKSLTSPIH